MKNILVVLFWLMSFCANAQNVVIKESCIEHKKGSPNREAVHSYFDKESNTLYLTFMGKKNLYLNTYVDMKKV